MPTKQHSTSADAALTRKSTPPGAALHAQTRAQPGIQAARLAPQTLMPADVLQLQRSLGNQAAGALAGSAAQAVQRHPVQRVRVAGIEVQNEGQMPTWEQDGEKYHINLTTETFHVTKETIPKIQYFYQGYGADIVDKQPTKAERGKNSTVFSALPAAVQKFVRDNYGSILKA